VFSLYGVKYSSEGQGEREVRRTFAAVVEEQCIIASAKMNASRGRAAGRRIDGDALEEAAGIIGRSSTDRGTDSRDAKRQRLVLLFCSLIAPPKSEGMTPCDHDTVSL